MLYYKMRVRKFLNRETVIQILQKSQWILSKSEVKELLKFFKIHDFNEVNSDRSNMILRILKYKRSNLSEHFINSLKYKRNSKEYLNEIGGEQLLKEVKNKLSCDAKHNFPNNMQYWLDRNYTIEDALKNIKAVQQDRANKAGKSFIRERSHRCVEYWMARGLTLEESMAAISELQTRDLQYFVSKYGEDEGIVRHQNKIKNWQSSIHSKSTAEIADINSRKGKTFAEFVDLYGIERALEIVRSRTEWNTKSSKQANLFFKLLDEKLGNYALESFSAYKNKEWFIRSNTGIFFVDYRLGNKIIEYNGTIWHGDPRVFDKTDILPMLKVSASEIWKKDELRLNKLYSMGYTVKVIWELDVTRNIDGIIKECCDFIKG
jgi:hypothetical protein